MRMNQPATFGQFNPGQRKPTMAMMEITDRCNLRCPVCFARSTPAGEDISVDQARAYLEQLLAITETPIPIQISGGEPTLHPDLAAIIACARQLGYLHIELVTNGVRISQDPQVLYPLKDAGLKAVYLQFDGLQKETHLAIRGADLTDVRRQAVDAIRSAGLCCTLAVAVVRGINDREIGEIIRFGIENLDVVRAINFQAATAFDGRFDVADADGGLGTPELVDLVVAQSGLPAGSFIEAVLGNPLCNAFSLVFVVNGRLVPLFKFIQASDLRDFLGSKPRQVVLDAFEGKKSFFFRHLMSPKAWSMLVKAAPIFGRNPYNVLNSRHLLLFAKGFMNKDALDEKRIEQCCYGITGKDGVYSFCAYNNSHRFAGCDQKQPALQDCQP